MSTKQSGGGRRRSRRGSHAPMSEINVTPFVDVMLVLLIVFMVAAPMMTAGVPLELPQATGNQLQSQQGEPVVVSVTKEGKVFVGEETNDQLELDALGPKLKAISEARGGLDEPIFVRGDRLVSYGVVAKVMARIKDAGFRKLSLVTEIEAGG